jgi:outer membrane protein assembly factor BamB
MMRPITRRAALALPLALTGCGLFNGDWFGSNKVPLPGKREPVLAAENVLAITSGTPAVVLPPPVRNAAWPQPGGNPAHLMGNLQARPVLAEVWEESIGASGGYRQKILAQPVSAGGLVYTMDSAARVTCYSLSDGARHWRVQTKDEDTTSSNIGGGLGLADGRLYTVNGLGDVVVLDPGRGTTIWRVNVKEPIRGGPTIVQGQLFLTTIADRIIALETKAGRELWRYQATNAQTAMLGEPAPAFSDGLVVVGFASGELTALRADAGTVVWTDNLVAPTVGGGLLDVNSIRGMPVISGTQVFAIGDGGLVVSNDLHSGRRIWEHPIAGEDSPYVAGDWVFMNTLEQVLVAIHGPDGAIAWLRQLPQYRNEKKKRNPIVWFGPTLTGDRLVMTGTNNEALAVSPFTGQILGRQKLSGAAAPVQPVIVDGTLLLITEDGRLLALR